LAAKQTIDWQLVMSDYMNSTPIREFRFHLDKSECIPLSAFWIPSTNWIPDAAMSFWISGCGFRIPKRKFWLNCRFLWIDDKEVLTTRFINTRRKRVVAYLKQIRRESGLINTYFIIVLVFLDVPRVVYSIRPMNINWIRNEGKSRKIFGQCEPNWENVVPQKFSRACWIMTLKRY
jgi:hypothetical protein